MIAGRAAQRLQEEVRSTKCKATTLHRLLGYKSRSERTSKDAASGSSEEVSTTLSPVVLSMTCPKRGSQCRPQSLHTTRANHRCVGEAYTLVLVLLRSGHLQGHHLTHQDPLSLTSLHQQSTNSLRNICKVPAIWHHHHAVKSSTKLVCQHGCHLSTKHPLKTGFVHSRSLKATLVESWWPPTAHLPPTNLLALVAS